MDRLDQQNPVEPQQWSRKKSWGVGIGATLGICLLLALAYLSYSNRLTPTWHDARPTPTLTTSQSPAMTAEEQLAAQDKAKLGTHLALYGPAYNCADGRNNSAKRIADLKVCPLYVATVRMTGNKPSQPPVITMPTDNTGKRLIDIKAKPDGGWQTDSDTNQRVYKEYWIITVQCDPRIFPAGGNEHFTQNVTDHPGQWTGPAGVGECNKSFPLSAFTTDSVEIYGADPTLRFKGTALPLEKYGTR